MKAPYASVPLFATTKTLLSPGLIEKQGGTVGEVQAAAVRQHRDPQAMFTRQGIKYGCWQAATLRSKKKTVSRHIFNIAIAALSPRRNSKQSCGCRSPQKIGVACMLVDIGILAVVETGATHAFIAHLEAQWMNQVQRAACIRAKAYDITGIRRYLRFKQDNVEQLYDP
jgi:hypothetical protein